MQHALSLQKCVENQTQVLLVNHLMHLAVIRLHGYENISYHEQADPDHYYDDQRVISAFCAAIASNRLISAKTDFTENSLISFKTSIISQTRLWIIEAGIDLHGSGIVSPEPLINLKLTIPTRTDHMIRTLDAFLGHSS